MLQEIKDETKSNWGLDVHLLPITLQYVLRAKTSTLICTSWELICWVKWG